MTNEQLEAIRKYDTCQVSNAIETFHIRQRNEGFASGLQWMFPELPSIIGFACTSRIKTRESPPVGRGYLDRTDWWRSLAQVKTPRIAVMEDVDESPGLGAVLGETHAAILQNLGCVGLATNGAVRDLPALEKMRFAACACGASPSHSYAHVVAHSVDVQIRGLTIKPGDLLLIDRHGIVSIPLEIAGHLPAAIERQIAQERRVIDLCRSQDFSLHKLEEMIGQEAGPGPGEKHDAG